MITLTKNGNAIVFTFSDNAHYLFDGTIEVPVNSLTLITDNSQMATFKKSASNDIFISATYAELGMSKSELESWFKENACGSTGGGGVTSGEVETMIETSLEDYYDIDEVDTALANKADTSAVTAVANDVSTVSGQVATKVATSDFNTYTAATASAIDGKQDALQYYSENISDKTANIHIENTEFGTLAEVFADDQSVDMYASRTEEIEGSTVETNTDISNNPDGVAMAYGKVTDDEDTAHSYLNVEEGIISAEVYANEDTTTFEITSNGVTINNERVLTESDGVYYISFATIATTGIRDEDWDGIVAAIDGHRPIYAGYPRNDGGILYYGVECMNKNSGNTQIVMTASDNSSHYFYTFTKNGSNDYSYTVSTKPYVTDAEKTAWNAKQNALSAGTGIEISGNVISATGGGGGNKVVELTQAQYDALVDKDPDTFYIITDAQPIDINNYYNKTEVDNALSGKADTSAVTALSGAVDNAKAYYIDFGVLTTQGIHDADWDGLVAAINAHRPIYAGLPGANGLLYYTAECLYQDGSNIIRMTASDNAAHYFYTFQKNGSENYSFSSDTRPYTTQAEKDAWNAVSGKVNTSAITSAITSASTNAEVAGAKAVYDAIQAGGGSITVDSALDATSENPVQNKVIYAAIGNIESLLSNI